jgi:hypothetical protein
MNMKNASLNCCCCALDTGSVRKIDSEEQARVIKLSGPCPFGRPEVAKDGLLNDMA